MKSIKRYLPLAALALMFGFASCEEEPYVLDQASLMYSIQIDMANEDKAKIYVDETESQTLPLLVGESIQLGFTSDPADLSTLTYPDVAWSSSDESVVVVDQTGKITAKAAGIAVVTVNPSTVNLPATASIKVTVVADVTKVTSIEITDDSDHVSEFSPLPSCYIGESMTLSATVTPAEATYKTVLWSSKDESIAVIDPITGVVTGVAQGEVKMVATALDADKVSAEYAVYIDKVITPEGIKINNAPGADDIFSLGDGYFQVDFETYPAVSTKSKLTWTSSDPAVAAVDAKGKVTFNMYGEVDITVTVPESENTPEGFVKTQTMKFVIPAGFYREHFANEADVTWTIGNGGTMQWIGSGVDEPYLYFVPGVQNDASKLRGDIKRGGATYLSGDYPILCFRIDDVNDQPDYKNTNYKFDVSGNSEIDGTKFAGELGGGNRKWKKIYKCSDGSSIFYYDLATQNFPTGGALAAGNIVKFNTFQFKIADIKRKDGANHTADHDAYYRMFWFHTFQSEDALNDYLNTWSAETGITFE